MIVPGVPTGVLLSRAAFNMETAHLAIKAGDMEKALSELESAVSLVDQARKQVRQ